MGLKGIKELLLKLEQDMRREAMFIRVKTKDSISSRRLAKVVMFDMSQLMHKVRDVESVADLIEEVKDYVVQFLLADEAIVMICCDDRDNMPKPRAYTNEQRHRSKPKDDGAAAAAAAMEESSEDEETLEVGAYVSFECIRPSLREILFHHKSKLAEVISLLVDGLRDAWEDDQFTLAIAREGKWDVVTGGKYSREFIEATVSPAALARLGEADTKMVHAALKFAQLREPMDVILASTDWDILFLLLLNGSSAMHWDPFKSKEYMPLHWIHWVLHPKTPKSQDPRYNVSTVVRAEWVAAHLINTLLNEELEVQDSLPMMMDVAFLVALTGTDYGPKMASLESPTLLRYAFGSINPECREQMLRVVYEDGLAVAMEVDTGAVLRTIRSCFCSQRTMRKPMMTVGDIETAIRTALWWVMYSMMPSQMWKEPCELEFGYHQGIPQARVEAEFHGPSDTVEGFANELERDSLLFNQSPILMKGRGIKRYDIQY